MFETRWEASETEKVDKKFYTEKVIKDNRYENPKRMTPREFLIARTVVEMSTKEVPTSQIINYNGKQTFTVPIAGKMKNLNVLGPSVEEMMHYFCGVIEDLPEEGSPNFLQGKELEEALCLKQDPSSFNRYACECGFCITKSGVIDREAANDAVNLHFSLFRRCKIIRKMNPTRIETTSDILDVLNYFYGGKIQKPEITAKAVGFYHIRYDPNIGAYVDNPDSDTEEDSDDSSEELDEMRIMTLKEFEHRRKEKDDTKKKNVDVGKAMTDIFLK